MKQHEMYAGLTARQLPYLWARAFVQISCWLSFLGLSPWILAWLTSFIEPAMFLGEERPHHVKLMGTNVVSVTFSSLSEGPIGLTLTSRNME